MFFILSDHRFHTLREMADRLEVHRLTVYRHIQDLSLYYNITSQGGCCGGFRLLGEVKEDFEEITLTKTEAAAIIKALKAIGYLDDTVLIRKLKKNTR